MYSPETATRICQELIDGKSLRAICAADGMPAKSTVLGWLQDDAIPGFLDQYTRARELQAESLLDEVLEIADDETNDMVGGANGMTGNAVAVSRSRVRIDARKWAMSKLAPKKYGDKLDVTSGGEKIPSGIVEVRYVEVGPPLASSEKDIDDV